MLKITAIDSDEQRTLVLEGALLEPWISELERSWTEAQRAKGARKIVIDLRDVTAITQRGENLLFQMMAGGATLKCRRGVLTKHVLQQLERRQHGGKGEN